MDAALITSPGNPLIKQARALRQRSARGKTGLFLVEGIHPVGEVLEAGWEVQALIYSPDQLSSEFAHELLTRASERGIRLQPVAGRVMESISDKENPQGILAIVRQRLAGLDDLRTFRSGAAMVSPQDPGNLGAVLRTLDALEVDYLALVDGGVDPFHPTAVRASMGALFWKPVIRTDFADLSAWARRHAVQLIGSSAHGRQDYRTFLPRIPWLLLLGSEQKGLSAVQMQACEAVLTLPMHGRASSLNLAVAAGILLYQLALGK